VLYQAFSLSFAHIWLSPADKFPSDLIFWIPIAGRYHPCSSGTENWLLFTYFFSKSSDDEIVAHSPSQAEGLLQLSPDTAVSGFTAGHQTGRLKACSRLARISHQEIRL